MIPGLIYKPNIFDEQEQIDLLANIDALPWRDDLKRRVQHYGYVYDYTARKVTADMYLGPLPEFIVKAAEKINWKPDQAIVNEYLPGQGINQHIDCVPCFKDVIITISLGWPYEMELRKGNEKKQILLETGSVLVMTGESRYKWTHGIAARQKDNGVQRERRVSLTLRTVLL